MKILVADKFEKSGLDGLSALGCQVVYEPEVGGEKLPDALAKHAPDVLIVRSTKVPAKVLEGAKGVKVIVRAGAGVDNIDVAAASAKGIKVCNCPGTNAVAVAELAFGLLIACDRRIADQTACVRGGQWNKKDYSKTGSGGAKGLKGMTLGVIGTGTIGQAVIKRALAFEMNVLAWGRSLTAEKARAMGAQYGGSSPADLAKLASRCDAVSVHVAATPETKKLIGPAFFDAMKNGSYFINTSRGSVVDEAALRKAVQTKGVRAGLDVWDPQPAEPAAPWESETAKLPGVYGTCHSGASTDQAQQAVANETVRIVKVFKETGRVENCVNA